MIDLTPLDVRKKRGDFKKLLRGYDPQEVDIFLDLVAERMEALVRESIQLRERAETLQQQVSSQSGREHAVQEALVTAQELRGEIRSHAQREAELIVGEARARAKELDVEAERKSRLLEEALAELERKRMRFLRTFRQLLERELDLVDVEEARAPLEDRPIELDLSGGKSPEDQAAGTGDGSGGRSSTPVGQPPEDPRPALDDAVDELAAAHDAAWRIHETPAPDAGAQKSARDLLLPFDDEGTDPKSGGDPRWG